MKCCANVIVSIVVLFVYVSISDLKNPIRGQCYIVIKMNRKRNSPQIVANNINTSALIPELSRGRDLKIDVYCQTASSVYQGHEWANARFVNHVHCEISELQKLFLD